jgi:hypothetical protein
MGRQSVFLHRCRVIVAGGTTEGAEDRTRHAFYGAIQLADEIKFPRPQIVNVDAVGETITFSPMQTPGLVDRLLPGSEGFIGAAYEVQG